MATFQFKGVDEYLEQLQRVYNVSDEYIGKAIYKGADVVADAIKQATKELPTDDAPQKKDKRSGIRSIQKQGLVDSFGVAKLRTDGTFLNVKLGFDGYNKLKTKTWPNGEPNVVVARALESGKTFLPKIQFVSKATRKNKKLCEETMRITIDKEISHLVKK